MFYKEINNEIEIFKKAFQEKIPVMIKGPTGCGKSRFVQKMATELKINLTQIACNEETSSTDLQGRFLIENGNTQWYDGPATKAVKEGNILYLDEISEAKEDVIVVIHPLADHRRELYLDKKNEIITAHKNFMLVASYNPDYQNKIKDLKISTKQRFITLQFDYPPIKTETEIIFLETNIDIEYAQKLAKYAQKLRNLKNFEILEDVSTRLLINTAKLIKAGIEQKHAYTIGIIQVLSDDKDTQASLKDIMNLII